MFSFAIKLTVAPQGFPNLVGAKSIPSPTGDTYKVKKKLAGSETSPNGKSRKTIMSQHHTYKVKKTLQDQKLAQTGNPEKQSCPNSIPTRLKKPCRIRN
ncbi:hypothetical protein C7972_11059 [Arenibacter sp. ARW7G5Y1]|nr:hypothetical protein C7972_11059 [Arenibacter sp. ARW7G5Y1]